MTSLETLCWYRRLGHSAGRAAAWRCHCNNRRDRWTKNHFRFLRRLHEKIWAWKRRKSISVLLFSSRGACRLPVWRQGSKGLEVCGFSGIYLQVDFVVCGSQTLSRMRYPIQSENFRKNWYIRGSGSWNICTFSDDRHPQSWSEGGKPIKMASLLDCTELKRTPKYSTCYIFFCLSISNKFSERTHHSWLDW